MKVHGAFDIDEATRKTLIYFLNTAAMMREFKMSEKEMSAYLAEANEKFEASLTARELKLSDLKSEDEKVNNTLLEMTEAAKNGDIPKFMNIFDEHRKGFEGEDLLKSNREKLKSLGFAEWTTDNPIMLIPVWLYRNIPEGTSLKDINNFTSTAHSEDIGVDHPKHIRFGCLAWGFLPYGEQI